MKFTEEQLRIAAKQADDRLFEQLPDEAVCMAYTFSETFEQNMAQLIEQVKADRIAPAKVSMGWRYYTRNGLVAVLLCFMLSCMAMPDVVLAGYQKLVEVIETVVTEYTEYRYHSSETADAEFVPVTFGWLPDGMEEVWREENGNTVDSLYMDNNNNYLNIYQERMAGKKNAVYAVDRGDDKHTIVEVNGEELLLIDEKTKIQYVIMFENYRISGATNLATDELIRIISDIKM